MRVVIPLRPEAMVREPKAIHENLGESRTPKMLNLLHYSDTPVMERAHLAAQATSSRRVGPNMQQFQALKDVP
jgi:hypothetical protein